MHSQGLSEDQLRQESGCQNKLMAIGSALSMSQLLEEHCILKCNMSALWHSDKSFICSLVHLNGNC